jgi:hypothetical protein
MADLFLELYTPGGRILSLLERGCQGVSGAGNIALAMTETD